MKQKSEQIYCEHISAKTKITVAIETIAGDDYIRAGSAKCDHEIKNGCKKKKKCQHLQDAFAL